MPSSSDALASADLGAVFDAVPDAILLVDANGRVDFSNPAAARLTGYSQEAARGQPVAQILPLGREEDASELDHPAAISLREGEPVGPLGARLLAGAGGPFRVVDISASPVRLPDGSITGTILIARDVTQQRRVARQLSHQATHDPLTGLVNRAEFERRVAQALAHAPSEGAQHTLGFVDLDGFKQINDACGHLAGDELLRTLSAVLRRRMRARDTVARLGGDEFGILLEHCPPAMAARIAEHAREDIERCQFSWAGKSYSVAASIGLVPLASGGRAFEEILRAADLACYRAKRAGGNRVQLSHWTGHSPARSAPR
jgi:diguanylate cyclase (GGDEF)-like protein/PAS domain S-box-containing protein